MEMLRHCVYAAKGEQHQLVNTTTEDTYPISLLFINAIK